MYAIIATGGKQYKVSEGDVIKVEKLDTIRKTVIDSYLHRLRSIVSLDNILRIEL